jgi:hypothetical protein
VRHAISLVFALCISIIGGTAFVYLIHVHHSSMGRWLYTSAAMLFLTGVMVYDELFVQSITCTKCRRTS